MRAHRFDALAKALGRTETRRGVVRTLSGAVAAAILAGRQDRPVHAQFGACPTGTTECSGVCVDTSSDPANCGFCRNSCTGGTSCQFGSCRCPSGTSECGGLCVDTSSDPANCGFCRNSCTGGTSCQFGGCRCPGGTSECSGVCVNTSSDPGNCGFCGNSCRGGESCRGGLCVSENQAPVAPTIERGRDVEPPPESGPSGASVQTLASGSLEVLAPGTAYLSLGRVVLEPKATIPFDPTDPSAVLIYTASGELTFRVDAPMTVARKPEPGTSVPAEPEAVEANTEFTLRQGDSALFPPAIAGEVRNDGDAQVVASVVNIAIQVAAAGTPTP
jgi:hypothetical protein